MASLTETTQMRGHLLAMAPLLLNIFLKHY